MAAALSTGAATPNCSRAAASTARLPSTASPTQSSCNTTSSSARRWRDCERADRGDYPWARLPKAGASGERGIVMIDARGRLRNIALLFAAVWKLIRGEDQRARKVRWMIGLLRPYRGKVVLMFVALLVATGAGLAPPYLAKQAVDNGIITGDVSALDWIVAAF